jgi:hypothetical protein
MKIERNKTQMKVEENRMFYVTTSSDGVAYVLGMDKSLCAVRFGNHKTESETIMTHDIYASNMGGLYVCTNDGKIEKKISIPAEFVHAKYYELYFAFH